MRSLVFAVSVAALSIAGAAPQPPGKIQLPRRTPELEALFGQLGKAASPEEARPIEERIPEIKQDQSTCLIDRDVSPFWPK